MTTKLIIIRGGGYKTWAAKYKIIKTGRKEKCFEFVRRYRWDFVPVDCDEVRDMIRRYREDGYTVEVRNNA